ncbi:hypothetical protein SDC9_209886 [bioreactor metagenome]|uniref:Uncharacterized protein n=1 Tax=bioreactor metagenome TaxID=1076179 RepID=A0A645JHG7_9ZZZZ
MADGLGHGVRRCQFAHCRFGIGPGDGGAAGGDFGGALVGAARREDPAFPADQSNLGIGGVDHPRHRELHPLFDLHSG